MINHYAIQKALRAKLLTLEVCTTGSITLAVTSTAFTRTTGSFVTDGFVPGLEVTGTGFAESGNNAAKTITSVSALSLTCSSLTAESAVTATLTAGLPADRAWENVELTPTTGKPFIEESYLPGPMQTITLGPLGELEILPSYVVKVFVPLGNGMGAARKYADALLALFAPRTPLTVSNHSVTVRTDVSPFSGQLLRTESGFGMIPVTVPLRVRTANSI